MFSFSFFFSLFLSLSFSFSLSLSFFLCSGLERTNYRPLGSDIVPVENAYASYYQLLRSWEYSYVPTAIFSPYRAGLLNV